MMTTGNMATHEAKLALHMQKENIDDVSLTRKNALPMRMHYEPVKE
jgi:hypothetical protein